MTKALHHGLLNKLRSNRELLRKPDGCARLELYHRASSAVRVSRKDGSESVVTRTGFEEGVAVRLVMRGSGAIAFSAASGGDGSSLQWAIDRACEHGGGQRSEERAWPLGGEFLHDLDSDGALPPTEDLISWLNGACGRLDRPNGWVEAVTTVESWVADGGPQASRSRTRGWAMASGRSRPLILASRRWEELPTDGWADMEGARLALGEAKISKAGGKLPILFTAEAAADLVSALVRGYFIRNESLGTAAGSGWVLADDPASQQALFGGSFDDATFPARRRLLADGRQVVACIAGPGQLRRSSFRDPPQPLASHLIVETSVQAIESDYLLATGLTVHPLTSEEWIIEFEGSASQEVKGFMRTGPQELIRGCVAGVGSSRLSHRGVRTPALLFEGLRVEF